MLMLTLIVAFAMPTILYCSFVLPDSAISGWVLSAMTLVGAVTGFTLGPVYKKLKKWTLPVAGLFLGVLYVVCALNAQPGSFNLVVYIATFLVGHWGFAIVIPATGNMITNLVPIGAATRAMGFNTAFHQAGCFLATPVATLVMGLLGAQAVTDLLPVSYTHLDVYKRQVRVRAGRVAETLAEQLIEPFAPDLVVCGERGLSNIKYVFVGSVSTYLIRNLRCDVLVVKQA